MLTDKSKNLRIFSWILYDFANTIYSFIVVTYYLPPLLEKATRSNFLMSFSTIFSMVLAGVSAPVLGALTDRTRAAKKWLILSTVVCCLACSAIGLFVRDTQSITTCHIMGIFLMFVIANYTYQIGLMFYNSFLPALGTKNELGKISGLGIAFGYAGPLFILPLSGKVANVHPFLVFPFGGLAFFIFSLPLFLFLPEREPLIEEKVNLRVIRQSIRGFLERFRLIKDNRNLFCVLLTNFFAIDAVNTAIIFLTTYLENAAWITRAESVRSSYKMIMMFSLIICSMLLSFFIGFLCDKTNSKKAFLVSVLSMVSAIIFGILLSDTGLWLIVIVAPLGGAGLGGVWTAGRKMVADITPHGKEGEFFGLYGLVGKVSAFGTVIFAVLTWWLPEMGLEKPAAYKAAFLFQCIALVFSLVFLGKVQLDKKNVQ